MDENSNHHIFNRLSRRLNLLTAILVIVYFARLWVQASGAKFYTDECFHAYVSEWIASHSQLPKILPEFYSGFFYYYPPLFHIIGAFAIKVAGIHSLNYLNILITGLLFLCVYIGALKLSKSETGRWTVLLCLSNSWLTLHALRFYAEPLTTLFSFSAVLTLLLLPKTKQWRWVLLSGLALGLSLLTKQSAILLVIIFIILAATFIFLRNGRLAKAVLLSLCIALLISLPFFVKNYYFFGSPFYPALGPDIHHELYELTSKKFILSAKQFYQTSFKHLGLGLWILICAALSTSIFRRQWNLHTGLLILSVTAFLVTPFLPMHDPRHIHFLIPLMSFSGFLILFKYVQEKRALCLAVDLVLIAASVTFIAGLPNYRQSLDVPPGLKEAYEAIPKFIPQDKTILSLWTYDTFYYTKRRATWPIPWGQSQRPIEIFYEKDPDQFLKKLHQYSIDYILAPQESMGPEFDSANYPETFIRCLSHLVEKEKVRLIWQSEWLALFEIN